MAQTRQTDRITEEAWLTALRENEARSALRNNDFLCAKQKSNAYLLQKRVQASTPQEGNEIRVRTPLFSSVRTTLGRLLRRSVNALEAATPLEVAVARASIERLVGTSVGDLALYEQALRHRSRLRGRPDSHLHSNERLEFLGDAVLGFVVAEHLYCHFPTRTEGFMTRLRAKLVNGQALARYAEQVGLGALILMSENMVQSDGRQNQTILADAFEAVIGALYLDQGLGAARRFIHRTMLDGADLDRMAEHRDNHKSALLEYAQAQGWPQPHYRLMVEEGPSHDRRFTVEVLVRDEAYGQGQARSKKSAEQKAARKALQRLLAEEEGGL